MIDKFDYLEPACPLSGGKEFYYPRKDASLGSIPVDRVIAKVDSLFDKNDYVQAGKLLNYWREEAIALRDKRGQLSLESELIGYYRKRGDRERGSAAIASALALVEELGQEALPSGGTVFINCATAWQSFGKAEEAICLFARAEQVYKNTLPEGDSRFGGLYNNMALALVELGRYEQAKQAYAAALKVMSQVPGGEAECAITYINLSYLYEAAGDGERIRDCMEKARQLLQSDELPRNGYYAFVLEKCAPAFDYFGEVKTAAQMKKEAEEIYARS